MSDRGPPTSRPSQGPDLLLDGLATLITEGSLVGTPMLRAALDTFAAGGGLVHDQGPAWWTLADAAGSEADIATTMGRD
jgi:hypothetical protein